MALKARMHVHLWLFNSDQGMGVGDGGGYKEKGMLVPCAHCFQRPVFAVYNQV